MRRLALLLAILAVIAVGLVLAWSTLRQGDADGDGERTGQTVPVGAFRNVEVSGHADVVLVQGEAEAIDVEASPKRHARVRVRAQGGTVKITVGEDAPWWSGLSGGSSRPPRLTVRFRELESIAIAGAVRLSGDGVKATRLAVRASGAAAVRLDDLDAGSLRFSGSGAVKAEVSGRATGQEVSISGAGTYRAPRLVSESAEIKVSGAGRVVVNASRSLDAAISGAGAIDYHGSPQVRQRISGAGRIRQVSEAVAPARVAVAATGAVTR
ncbi:MAG: DUF2807 domain-containing protein [Betaproteobacteria bacterium]|nr:DUF2807 domain-containing protein [Betaproteobacteria bacterium]